MVRIIFLRFVERYYGDDAKERRERCGEVLKRCGEMLKGLLQGYQV